MDQGERASAATLGLYAQRASLNLYEVACLAHGADPELVATNTHGEQTARRHELYGESHGPVPAEMAELISLIPETILGPDIGATLRALCKATGATIQAAVTITRARRLLRLLGLDLPTELSNADSLEKRQRRLCPESAEERQRRRLKRFRELGGEVRSAGSGFHCVGRRGALADLVREERTAGRVRSDRSDVRRDLDPALEVHRGS